MGQYTTWVCDLCGEESSQAMEAMTFTGYVGNSVNWHLFTAIPAVCPRCRERAIEALRSAMASISDQIKAEATP